MEKNIWLSVKNKANLKPDLKMNVVWKTCDKNLGGEMKSAYKNYSKSLLQKSRPFRDTYAKYLENNSI